MRLAIYGQPKSYTKEEIAADMIRYIEQGVDIFDFLSYGDFEITTAQVLRKLKSTKYSDIYTILYRTDRNIVYDKSIFDIDAIFSSMNYIQDCINDILYESDFVYPEKLDKA